MEAVIKFIMIYFISLSSMTSVKCQTVLNVVTIPDKGIFDISCDASRVKFPAADSATTSINKLTIYVQTNYTSGQIRKVAQYLSYGPSTVQKETKTPPEGRNWIISFSGSNNGENNRNTMKIEILVRNSMCLDSGNYICSVDYYTNALNVTQNATGEGPLCTDRDKYRRYLCVIREGGVETLTTNVTIDLEEVITTPGGGSAASAGGSPTSSSEIGLIVGVVIGGIAAIVIIAIIIAVIVHRKRRSKAASSKKDTDQPDGGATGPETYSVSSHDRRHPNFNQGYNSRDRQVPTGRTNKALDTSYDNTNKLPPVYSTTNNNEPPRQKEFGRGQQNSGFDNEGKQDDYSQRPPDQDQGHDYYNYRTEPNAPDDHPNNETDYHGYKYEDADFGTGV